MTIEIIYISFAANPAHCTLNSETRKIKISVLQFLLVYKNTANVCMICSFHIEKCAKNLRATILLNVKLKTNVSEISPPPKVLASCNFKMNFKVTLMEMLNKRGTMRTFIHLNIQTRKIKHKVG